MSKSVYVVAGEVSGDTHGAELMEALQEKWSGVEFRGLGGPAMRALAGESFQDWVDDAAVVGVWEVLRRYGWFKERFDRTLAEVLAWKPDVLLLIDYPGFNLRLAKQVAEHSPDTKIVHYVAPQVWAWNQKRIPQIAASHDLMLCLFPFEVPIFENAGLRSRCVGHPLVDELEEKRISVEADANLVGLFPGSRRKEVGRLFPMMLEAVRILHQRRPALRFRTAAASGKVAEVMRELLAQSDLPEGLVEIQLGESQALMQSVGCGVVASGTATLEAAYYGMPYCLVYQVAWPTYLMARQLVKLPFIGLINILAGREVVPEFIQNDANAYEVAKWMGVYVGDSERRDLLRAELLEAASKLGETGVHERAAEEITLLFSK
ncbi:lipid-A-disaccharide synthase [Verrucomicrobiaceae bacterium 227]